MTSELSKEDMFTDLYTATTPGVIIMNHESFSSLMHIESVELA